MRAKLLAAAAIACATPARATEVIARVSGVIGSAGVVRVSVCTRDEYPSRVCRLNARAPARPGFVDVRVTEVPPGDYAVIAHHDRSGEGVVHTDWLGIPTDGVGVSRDAIGWLGPPAWNAVALTIGGGTVAIDVTLRREPGG